MTTPTRPPTILLAEDDEDDRVIIASALRRSGIAHELEVMGDGAALLERLRRRAPSPGDAPEPPAPVIVFLDLDMPRKSGWDVLREIRADRQLQHIPVVVLTDSNRPNEQEHCFELGASAFVRKAFTIEEMGDALKETSRFFTRLHVPGPQPTA